MKQNGSPKAQEFRFLGDQPAQSITGSSSSCYELARWMASHQLFRLLGRQQHTTRLMKNTRLTFCAKLCFSCTGVVVDKVVSPDRQGVWARDLGFFSGRLFLNICGLLTLKGRSNDFQLLINRDRFVVGTAPCVATACKELCFKGVNYIWSDVEWIRTAVEKGYYFELFRVSSPWTFDRLGK